MIVLIARYTVKPGHTDEVLDLLRQMAERVRADEPGCTLYHVSRSRENPDLLLLYEHYRDDAAFNAHRETPHFREIIEGRIIPLLERRERELYDLAIA